MDSSLIEYNMIKYSPSVIAAASSYIVMKLYGMEEYKKLYSKKRIMKNNPESEIKECTQNLIILINKKSQILKKLNELNESIIKLINNNN